jgi:hypothetical protein
VAGGFYVFQVFSPADIVLGDEFVTLAQGRNTFNCHVRDIDTFTEKLKAHKVRIDKAIQLDAPDEDDPPLPPLQLPE